LEEDVGIWYLYSSFPFTILRQWSGSIYRVMVGGGYVIHMARQSIVKDRQYALVATPERSSSSTSGAVGDDIARAESFGRSQRSYAEFWKSPVLENCRL
jgi:hypothetical protein